MMPAFALRICTWRPRTDGAGNRLKRMMRGQPQILVTEHPFTLEDPGPLFRHDARVRTGQRESEAEELHSAHGRSHCWQARAPTSWSPGPAAAQQCSWAGGSAANNSDDNSKDD